MTSPSALEMLSRSMTIVRFSVLASLAVYLAVVQLVSHSGLEGMPPWSARALFAGVVALAAAIVLLRSLAQRAQSDERARLRWWIACYAACDLLGVAGLAVWIVEGDVRQATGAILAAGIFCAGGGRLPAPERARPQ